MKQIKFLGVLAIALALGLTACGGSKSSKSESKSEVPSSVVPASSSEAPADDTSSAPAESSEAPAESSEGEHVHTYAAEWSTNATYHWHAATCGHNVKDQNEKHTLVEVAPADDNNVPEGGKKAKAASCSEEGVKVEICSVCGYRKESKISKLAHTFAKDGDGNDVVVWSQEANCTDGGIGQKECTVCHEKVDVTTQALGHTFAKDGEGNDVVVWSQEANCTDGGIGQKECTVCHEKVDVETQALGHDWGEWEDINPADCTHTGLRKHTCARCSVEESEEVPALGHDIQLIGDDSEPEAGKAKVRMYNCANGCGTTYIGFKATEVTDASKARLVFEDGDKEGEKGARFFGHPIGNNVELDPTTGDPSEGNPAVYSKEQDGDFFEYVFDLTAEQVAAFGEEGCLMYCDAKPAQWMSNNNMDFFAKGSETDWTVAYYIDDNPAHYNDAEMTDPKEVEGWRYVLYVNDQYAELDANVATNKMANNNRGEFVLPYVFHFRTGENKISLRMAAGYRCTFFNFTFRPVPTPIVVGQENIEIREGQTAQITSEMPNLSYKSANTSIATVSETGLVTGVKAGTTTITVSKDGNYKPVVLPVTINEKEGVVKVEAETGTSPENVVTFRTPSGGSSQMTDSFPEGAALTLTVNSTLAGKFNIYVTARGSNINYATALGVKVNNADVTVSGTFNSSRTMVETLIGEADLIIGENTVVITRPAEGASTMPNIDFLRFVPQA